MGLLRSVGSIKLYVSFAEYRLFYRALLQKRPIILSILLTEATLDLFSRYWWLHHLMCDAATWCSHMMQPHLSHVSLVQIKSCITCTHTHTHTSLDLFPRYSRARNLHKQQMTVRSMLTMWITPLLLYSLVCIIIVCIITCVWTKPILPTIHNWRAFDNYSTTILYIRGNATRKTNRNCHDAKGYV